MSETPSTKSVVAEKQTRREERADTRLDNLSKTLSRKLNRAGKGDEEFEGEGFDELSTEVQTALGTARNKVASLQEQISADPSPKNANELIKERNKLAEYIGELEGLMSKYTEKQKAVAARLQESANNKKERSPDAVRLEEIEVRLIELGGGNDGLKSAEAISLMAESAELGEKKLETIRLGKSKREAATAEARITAADEFLATALGELENEDGDGSDDTTDRPAEEDSEDTAEEIASDDSETTDEGQQEVATLSDKLSEATRGLTEGIVDDLQDTDNVVKQAFVSAKSFLVMFLLGKGGKKASWLTQFDSDELTLLEKGIGLKVERVDGKAKVNEDGGVTVEWVDPQPEFMPPMRAIKVYKDVFGPNWADTPAQKISRTTTMDEMIAFREAANKENGDQANWDTLINVMTKVNKKEIEGDTLVVDFLEDQYANVRVELGADRETVEAEEAASEPTDMEARLEAADLTMESTLEESATKLELDEAVVAAIVADYNKANAEETPLATADSLTMQNLSDSGQIYDLIPPASEEPTPLVEPVPEKEPPEVIPANKPAAETVSFDDSQVMRGEYTSTSAATNTPSGLINIHRGYDSLP